MIRLNHDGKLIEFADRDAIVAHFDLTTLSADTLSGIQAASDVGFPLQAAVDPCTAEIRGRRVLMLDNDAERDAYFAIVQQEIDAMDPVPTGIYTSDEAVANDDIVIAI